jgi:hypothetical protein
MLTLLPTTAQDHAPQPESTTYELAESDGPAHIPFQLASNEVRVDVTVNGSGPFHLIVDTGMPIPGLLLFKSERVDALHLEDAGQRVKVAGGGGDGATSEAVVASGISSTIGDLKMSKASALVIAKPAGIPPAVDGVVGGSLFFHFVVHVDMDQHRIDLYRPDKWSPPSGACSVPLVRDGGRVFVDVRTAIGDEPPAQARVVVDLGAGHALSLNTRGDGTFAPPANAIEMPLGRGVSGVVLGKVGRARRLEIGTFAFENVVMTFPIDKHRHPGGVDFHDGNLGAEVLKRFDVTFDYAGQRMLLEKGKAFGEPFEHEMAGLALDWQDDSTLMVGAVLAKSPGEAADIQVGDTLIAIDGRSIADVGENGVTKVFTQEGKELRLTFKRGGESIEKRIRLRRLV